MKPFSIIAVLALLSFAALGETLRVSWSPNPAGENVTSCRVFVSTNGSPFVETATTTSTNYQIFNPRRGAVYEFRVAAVNAIGTNESSKARSPIPPRWPTGVIATATNTTITVNWQVNNPAEFVLGYNVTLLTNGVDGAEPMATETVAEPPAIFSAVPLGIYAVRVRAENLAGQGGHYRDTPIEVVGTRRAGFPSEVKDLEVEVTR